MDGPPTDRTLLSPARRRADRARLADEVVDVLVIGGGVTGAGAALDAASRGLTVGLLEARDWASGTSSRSSKLIHGGLRYLEQLAFPLVQEALRERSRLVRTIAPHLVTPLPFLLPLTSPVWQRAYFGAGVALYDVLGAAFGSDRGIPAHRHLSRPPSLLQMGKGGSGDRGACILTHKTPAAFSALPTVPVHDQKSPAQPSPVPPDQAACSYWRGSLRRPGCYRRPARHG